MTTPATQLTITIPDGAPPGSILKIPIKNGQETVKARVPEGLIAGSTLVLTKLEGSDEWVEDVRPPSVPASSRGQSPAGPPFFEEQVASPPSSMELRSPLQTGPPQPISSAVAYTVRLDTTVGVIDIIVRPDWAPHGARRFLDLAAHGDLDDLAFYRSVKGCLAQFGLPARRPWPQLPDDPPTGVPFLLGAVCFAAVGENSRKSTLFICIGDMSHNFGQRSWETPIGAVAENSLDVLDRIETIYGDIAECNGAGPNTGRINADGNAYLRQDFPLLTYIRSACPLDWQPPTQEADQLTQAAQAAAAAQEAQAVYAAETTAAMQPPRLQQTSLMYAETTAASQGRVAAEYAEVARAMEIAQQAASSRIMQLGSNGSPGAVARGAAGITSPQRGTDQLTSSGPVQITTESIAQGRQWTSIEGTPSKSSGVVDVPVELSPTARSGARRMVDVPVDVVDVPVEILPPRGRGPPIARGGRESSVEAQVWRTPVMSHSRAVGSGASPVPRASSPMPQARNGRPVMYDNSAMFVPPHRDPPMQDMYARHGPGRLPYGPPPSYAQQHPFQYGGPPPQPGHMLGPPPGSVQYGGHQIGGPPQVLPYAGPPSYTPPPSGHPASPMASMQNPYTGAQLPPGMAPGGSPPPPPGAQGFHPGGAPLSSPGRNMPDAAMGLGPGSSAFSLQAPPGFLGPPPWIGSQNFPAPGQPQPQPGPGQLGPPGGFQLGPPGGFQLGLPAGPPAMPQGGQWPLY